MASSSVGEPLDRHHRAEDLLLHDRIVRRAAGEDRRAEEEAACELGLGGPRAAGEQPRALGQAQLDVALHLAAVPRRPAARSRWPGPCRCPAGSGRRAPPARRRSCRAASSTISRAPAEHTWPRVQERRGQRVVDRGVEVGVGEHDVRVLAAELERDPPHVRAAAAMIFFPVGQPAGERDQVDIGGARPAPAPTRLPCPSTRFTTPGGTPASSSSLTRGSWSAG